ncbi:Dihem cytochrome c [Gloeocapsa sp. PCC 73106]|uniref:Dihem cytochrome c n=1 Tax=Gloeocapsa sp. PCC 73106 TaxID=102232 RepID=UPI0002ABE575|nr:Dihem cytochrome c [Gloeocapsa sp. PCC 73106]ELR99832.1 Dihem cytochrome c [Gloeocapsa sp. PCC 73106]
MFNLVPLIGYCLALIIIAQSVAPVPPESTLATGKDLYIQHCSSCHLPIAAEVLPTETWKEILERPQNHYGTSVTDLVRISQVVIWQYLMTLSRPLRPQEVQPTFVRDSRYFKALHPRVEFPDVVNSYGCIACHPGAQQANYQQLTSQWDDAP